RGAESTLPRLVHDEISPASSFGRCRSLSLGFRLDPRCPRCRTYESAFSPYRCRQTTVISASFAYPNRDRERRVPVGDGFPEAKRDASPTWASRTLRGCHSSLQARRKEIRSTGPL